MVDKVIAVCNYDYYENEQGPVLRIIGRDKEQNRIILDVQDEKLTPHFFVRAEDMPLFLQTVEERNVKRLILRTEKGLPTAMDEETECIYTKFPRHVRNIRDAIAGMLSFNGDIKWEKLCFQIMRWKQFLKIKDYDPWSFTPLENISNSNEVFQVNYNICYFDIETDNSNKEVRNIRRNIYLFSDKIPIISYVIYNKHQHSYTYYGWKLAWTEEILYSKHQTSLGEKALGMDMFAEYSREYTLIIKRFNNEKKMHQTFLSDFSKAQFDGIMTFNGRGGVRIVGGERKWYNGYDMPLFYARCLNFGLEKELQLMSPIPPAYNKDFCVSPSIKVYSMRNSIGEEEKHEIYIKCVPQHDLFYDDSVLFYSKNEYEMKQHGLNDYMTHFLGIGKLQHPGLMVWELFEENEEKEMLYNIIDVEGMVALDIYFRYTDDVAGRALLYGGKIEDAVYATKIHDHINLWFAQGIYVMESRDNEREDVWKGMMDKKEGGFNMDVDPQIIGYREKCCGITLDFSKLYPTCGMSANADLRTKINVKNLVLKKDGLYIYDIKNIGYKWEDCTHTPAGFFRKDIKSLNTIIYKELITKRKELQKLTGEWSLKKSKTHDMTGYKEAVSMYNVYYGQQFSYKGLINGKFGSSGRENTRDYDKVIYNTLPGMGQVLIKMVIKYLIDKGYHMNLSSTDSVFFIAKSTDPMVAWNEAQALVKDLNENIIPPFVLEQFNAEENFVKIDCEYIWDVAIFFNKRYYMLNVKVKEENGQVIVLDKPEPIYKGLEYVRRDASMITYQVQGEILRKIFERRPEKEIIDYLKKIDFEFETYKWSLICSHAGISDDIEKHESQKYIACRNGNRILKRDYNAGASPFLGVFAKHPIWVEDEYLGPGVFPMAFEEEDEFPLKKMGFDLDYNHLKEVNLKSKVQSILNIIFERKYDDIIYEEDDIREM